MKLKQKIMKLFGLTGATRFTQSWDEFIDKYYIWGVMLIGILIYTLSPVLWKNYRDNRENERRENFNKNYEIFRKLEQMQKGDIEIVSSISINEKYRKQVPDLRNYPINTVWINNIDEKRFNEYKKLLNQAKLSSFAYVFDEPKKRYLRFHKMEGSNDSGYAYMEYPPPIYFNKFSECEPVVPSQSCYILLRPNWYMFSEKYRLPQEDAK